MKQLINISFLFVILILSFITLATADVMDDIDPVLRSKDYATAVRRLQPLADQGNAHSQYNIGVMYAQGWGVSKNNAEAAKWYQKAAEQGHASAQYLIALSYATGDGVPKDFDTAHKWLKLSAAQGNQDAAKLRDVVVAQLTEAKKSDTDAKKSDKDPTTGVFFLIIALLAWAGWWFYRKFRNIDPAEKFFGSLPEFTSARKWISSRTGNALAVDVERKKLALIDSSRRCSVVGFQEIIAVEIVRDGKSLIKSNRGSQVGGAAVGAVLLGPLGLLIGAVTGSKRKEEKTSKLSLKVYLSNILEPVREIAFYEGKPVDMGSLLYKSDVSAIEEWHGRLRAIIGAN